MHLEIPQLPIASYAMDSIGQLPTTSNENRFALTFICLLTSYLIAVPLKIKTADEVCMVYIKEILPKTSCNKFILQDNGTEFKTEQLMSMFDTLDFKRIYSSPYYMQANSTIKSIHNYLKRPMAKFMHDSQMEWDDALISKTIADMLETNLAD